VLIEFFSGNPVLKRSENLQNTFKHKKVNKPAHEILKTQEI
jgi:hypothetical protein